MSKLRHYAEEDVLKVVKSGVSPYLVGPTGSGKTRMAQNIADDMGLPFYYASAVDSEYKLKGFVTANGHPVLPSFAQSYGKGGYSSLMS